ncbi:MAG: 30S ribosomal protein S7 [Candidatus Wildermuthbacteria bacterium]|nr:30S ribosomal protein S7 [Candidatus Wildermuthbacteria bacterium]
MGRSAVKKLATQPDGIYNKFEVAKLINQIMKEGRKNAARKIVYGAFGIIQKQTSEDPVAVFERALENVGPMVEVRSKRVGGATYQVPVEVKAARRLGLSLRWIISAAGSKKGKPMREKLADEIILAAKKEGSAVKKKEDTHRMAEANRAFAHFAW